MSSYSPGPPLPINDKNARSSPISFGVRFSDKADNFEPSSTDGRKVSSDAPWMRQSTLPSKRSPSVDSTVPLLDPDTPDIQDSEPRMTARKSLGANTALPLTRSTMNPPYPWHPTGYVYRFVILGLVAYMLLAGYFADETIGATTSELRSQMSLSPKEIGWIYSAGYGPNIIMIFIGGILVDKFGVKLMSLIYTALVVAGLAIFALVPPLWGRILGRVIFGMGFEPLEVCSDAIVMRWYASSRVESRDGTRYRVGAPSIPMAFSVLFSVGIFGQFLSLNVLPSVLAAFNKNLTYVYLLVTAIGVTAFVFNIVFVLMDWIAARNMDMETTVSEAISFRVLTHFPLTYWIIMGVCVAGYSCQYVFMIYASDYIHEKWGYSDIKSGNWASIVYVFAIVLSPMVGYFIERRGQALTLMGLGCLSFAFGCIIMGTIPPSYLPAIPLILMGIAYSLVPATVWSSISDVIPEPLAGTGFGVMTAIMSFTYMVIPSGVGAIHDFWNSYEYMNFAFAFFALVSFAGVLWIAKIEPDLNLPPRSRRRNLAAYNVVTAESDSEEEETDADGGSPLAELDKPDEFASIRERFAGPTPTRRGTVSRIGSEGTELVTVLEDDLYSEDETTFSNRVFSSSVVPDSWISNIRHGLDASTSSVSSSVPATKSFLRKD